MSVRFCAIKKGDDYGRIFYTSGKTDVTSFLEKYVSRRKKPEKFLTIQYPNGETASVALRETTEVTSVSEQGQVPQGVASSAYYFDVEYKGLKLRISIEKVKVWI